MDERTAAFDLAFGYARELENLDPSHELLQFVKKSMDTNAALHAIFVNRFWEKPFPHAKQPGYIVDGVTWANYAVAMRTAVEQLKTQLQQA